MKNYWKTIKTGLMLMALPLVATAAASAHHMISETTPLTSELATSAAATGTIGLARVHTVALNRNGAVEGRIASLDQSAKADGLGSLKIFFVQNGKVAQQTTTGDDGTFVIQGLAEGDYSFIAAGAGGFAAYGVQVVTDATGKFDNVMEAAAVSPRSKSVMQILKEKLPREVSQEIESSAVATDRQIVGASRVALREGVLKGQVATLIGSEKGTYVHIIQNDERIAEVQVDDQGRFVVKDLQPGVYDFVAAGPSGFAAVGFEAVAVAAVDSALADTSEMEVSAQDLASAPFAGGYSDSMDVFLTNQQDSYVVSNQLGAYGDDYYGGEMAYDSYAPIEYASEAIGAGCAVGGCCGAAGNFNGLSGGAGGGGLFGGGGSGGLFGGGGRLGRLALLGGLAVGIVAIADDSDPGAASPAGSQ